MAKKSKKSKSSSQPRAEAVVSVESVATAVGATAPIAVVPVKPQLNPFCIEPTVSTQNNSWQGDYDWSSGHRTADYEDDYYDDEDEYTQQARGLLPSSGDDDYWNASPNRRSAATARRSHANDNSWRIRACATCLVLPIMIVWMAWAGATSNTSSASELPSAPQTSPIANTPTTINAPKRRNPDPPQSPNAAKAAAPAGSSPQTTEKLPTQRPGRLTSSPTQPSVPIGTTKIPRPPAVPVVVVTAAPTKTPGTASTPQKDIDETDDDDDDDTASSSGSQEEDQDDDKEDDLDTTPRNGNPFAPAAAAATAKDSASRPTKQQPRRIVVLGERHSGVEWWQSTLQACFSETTIVAGLEPRRRGPYWFQTVISMGKKDSRATIPVRDGDVIVVAVRNPYHWVELLWQHPRYAPNHATDDPLYPLPLRKFLAQPWSPNNATSNNGVTNTVRSDDQEKCQLGFTPQQVTPCLSMPSLVLPLNDSVPVYELDENGRVFANILQLRAAKIRHWLDDINAALNERTNNDDPHDRRRRMASRQRGVLLLPYEAGLTNATLQALQALVGRPSSCRVNDSAWAALPPSTNLLGDDDASLEAWRNKQVHGAKYKKYMLEHVNWREEGRIGYYPESNL
jgi:hypothetical protein